MVGATKWVVVVGMVVPMVGSKTDRQLLLHEGFSMVGAKRVLPV